METAESLREKYEKRRVEVALYLAGHGTTHGQDAVAECLIETMFVLLERLEKLDTRN